MKELNLSWGNSLAVRQAFISGLSSKVLSFSLNDANLNYTEHDGNPQLIEITRQVVLRQTGKDFKHIFLVNGATGGVTITLRAYKRLKYRTCVTRKPPHFPIYPEMIKSAGLIHQHTNMFGDSHIEKPENCFSPVILIDSPSNPHGLITEQLNTVYETPIIWDAVYHGKAYLDGEYNSLKCDVVVGSYSKLLGLNGIRTGWIATNNDVIAMEVKKLVEAEYLGLSSASNFVLLNVLKEYKSKTFWENFEYKAKKSLDYNREEWSKLEKYFCGISVPSIGMFHWAPIDNSCRKLLEKSGIIWTKGSSMGVGDDYGRFNVGQDCKVVQKAVKEILKNDKI